MLYLVSGKRVNFVTLWFRIAVTNIDNFWQTQLIEL